MIRSFLPVLRVAGDASNTPTEEAQQVGMGHDGIGYFQLRPGVLGEASMIGLLAMNHEFTTRELMSLWALSATID